MLFLKHEPTEKLREDELKILLLATQKLGLPAETRKKESRNITRFVTVVNLSMKINENVRKFKEIFTVITEILQEKQDFIKIKDEMIILELILQENTGFLLEFDSPFKFLILILKDLNLSMEIGRKSWKIAQYSLFSPVILQIVPHALAVSAIYISVILSSEKGKLSDQVVKGVLEILKLLLNKKIQENFNIGENQDLILEILNCVQTNGLVDTGFFLQSNKSHHPRQNVGHNNGYGQNQYHGYVHGNAQSHGRPIHIGSSERREKGKDERKRFTPANGMGLSAHTPAPVTHAGHLDYRHSSSGPSYSSVPDKRKHSDQYDKRESRGDSRSRYDRRQKYSSTDSYSDDSYDRDHDKEGDYRSSRDERDDYRGRGRDYERRSDHHDRKDDKIDDGDYKRKSYDQGNSDHRRKSYDHGGSRNETGRHRNESKYYRDDRYSNKKRDGSSYQSQSSYHSRR